MQDILGGFLFWWDCIVRGANVGGGVFGILEILCALLWLTYRTKKPTKRAQAREEKLREYCKIAFLVLFVFTTLIAAPYQKYKASERLTATRTNDVPDGVLLGRVAEIQIQAEKEKVARMQAERDREEYRNLGMKWLLATNVLPNSEAITQAIGLQQRDIARTLTNKSLSSLQREREISDREREIASLQKKQSFNDQIKTVLPFHKMATYAASVCERLISDTVRANGTPAITINVPTAEWMAHHTLETNMVVTIGTNSTWKFGWKWKGASVEIYASGQKAKPATGFLKLYGDRFQTKLVIGDINTSPDYAIADTTNCLARIEAMFNALVESQQAEFQ